MEQWLKKFEWRETAFMMMHRRARGEGTYTG